MTTSGRAAVIRRAERMFDAVNKRDLANTPWWTQDTVYHLLSTGVLLGRDEILAYFDQMIDAMPDVVIEIERVVADGDVCTVQWECAGSFVGGQFLGLRATGQRLMFRGVDVIEFDGDRVASNTVLVDGLAFARQVGMLPGEDTPTDRALRSAFNAVTALRRTVTGGQRRLPAGSG